MSKGLEALKNIKINCCTFEDRTLYQNEFNIIEKELKALEIIKNKKVNVLIFCGCDTLEEYNKHPLSWWKLTQEEYDLLKEVML